MKSCFLWLTMLLAVSCMEYSIDNPNESVPGVPNPPQLENRIKKDIIRNNNLISKEFDLSFNQEVGKYIIGITSTNTPEIRKYALFSSFKQSISFIPTYYVELFKYLTLETSLRFFSRSNVSLFLYFL